MTYASILSGSTSGGSTVHTYRRMRACASAEREVLGLFWGIITVKLSIEVIGCNGEVRGGAPGVGVHGDSWRYGILFDTCIDIVSRIACGCIGYSQRPSRLIDLGRGGGRGRWRRSGRDRECHTCHKP
jgi:hypothetical protein